MKLVIDTNVLISALIRDSVTRKIIVYSGLDLYYPEISLHELRKHEKETISKTKLAKGNYRETLSKLFEYIELIPEEMILKSLNEAKKIMLRIDPDDVVFIASALSIDADIWTNDKDFNKQNKIKIWYTEDLIKLFLK